MNWSKEVKLMAYNYPYFNNWPSNYSQINSVNNGYQQPPQMPQQTFQQPPQMPYKTNKLVVTSLDEAMMRSSELNSDTVYFDQNKDVLYNVKVDSRGYKTCDTYKVSKADAADSNTSNNEILAIKANMTELSNRVDMLTSKLQELFKPAEETK